MDQRVLKVVISSTAMDLDQHRAEVTAACQSQNFLPVVMETLTGLDADAVETSLAMVDSADIYLGVFAWRYGYVPDGHDISVTEMEYQRAEQAGKPRLLFIAHPEHPIDCVADVETGAGAEKLQAFLARVQTERVVGYFRSPADLRALVIDSLARLQSERAQRGEAKTDTPAPIIPATRENNPYVSLAAFQCGDAGVFFGRETLTRDTLADFYALLDGGPRKVRWLAILGPSGSGKSSFARAGLLAQLTQRESERLRFATLVPGARPMQALGEAMTAVCGDGFKLAAANNAQASPIISLPASFGFGLVLLVDQFEEIWSLCDDARERQCFIDALIGAAGAPEGRISVIVTLRSDFLGYTQRHPALDQLVAGQSVMVPAMSAENLRSAIVEPARRAGQILDEETVGQLIGETLGHEGVLPLLQFVLNRIWLGLVAGVSPAQTLIDVGGVGGALAKSAEDEYQSLNADQQSIARRAFLGMVQLGEGARDTRRRVPERRLLADAGSEAVDAVLERFAHRDRRLITRTGDGREASVEVTHEALFGHWLRLQQWLETSRDALRFRRKLEDAVAEYRDARQSAGQAGEGAVQGLLWRPPRLTELEQYQQMHPDDPLDDDEQSFLQASQDLLQGEIDEKSQREAAERQAEKEIARAEMERQQSRSRFLRNTVIALGAVALMMASMAGFFAFTAVHGLNPRQALNTLAIRFGRDAALPTLVNLPGGDFEMGSKSGDEDERPPHPVTVGAFAIGAHEVTFREFKAYRTAMEMDPRSGPDDEDWGEDSRPVINVTWDEAKAYAKWLGTASGRFCGLPTEAEWEYAARAGSETAYYWGDPPEQSALEADPALEAAWLERVKEHAWFEDNSDRTQEVGRLKPNAFNLYDMAGNTWEWLEDCWHDSYEDAPDNGRAWLEEDGGSCRARVLRGGSWGGDLLNLRSAYRFRLDPVGRYLNVGFRVVCRPQDVDH